MSREAAKDNSPGLQAWESETRGIRPERAQKMRIHRPDRSSFRELADRNMFGRPYRAIFVHCLTQG
jgi:hypothetical protein